MRRDRRDRATSGPEPQCGAVRGAGASRPSPSSRSRRRRPSTISSSRRCWSSARTSRSDRHVSSSASRRPLSRSASARKGRPSTRYRSSPRSCSRASLGRAGGRSREPERRVSRPGRSGSCSTSSRPVIHAGASHSTGASSPLLERIRLSFVDLFELSDAEGTGSSPRRSGVSVRWSVGSVVGAVLAVRGRLRAGGVALIVGVLAFFAAPLIVTWAAGRRSGARARPFCARPRERAGVTPAARVHRVADALVLRAGVRRAVHRRRRSRRAATCGVGDCPVQRSSPSSACRPRCC